MAAKTALERLRRRFGIRDDLARCVLCEFFCTFFLMYVGISLDAHMWITRTPIHAFMTKHLGWGITLFFAIQMGYGISGSHMNPAVSFFMYSFGNISFRRFLFYTIAQFAGAFCGSVMTFVTYYDGINEFDGGVRQVYGPSATAGIFATYPRPYLSVTGSIVDQIACTAILCLCICVITDKRNKIPLHLQPFYMGFMLFVTGISIANAGNAMNPARDLAPRFMTYLFGYGSAVFSYRDYTWFWVPVICPFLGAMLGSWAYQIMIGVHLSDPSDEETDIMPLEVKVVPRTPYFEERAFAVNQPPKM